MLIDHEIRVAQVFHIEGNIDEAKRQEILMLSRSVLLRMLPEIEASIKAELQEAGCKAAGKVRGFVATAPYEAPVDAEWEQLTDVQSVLHPTGQDAGETAVPDAQDESGGAGTVLESQQVNDATGSEGSGDREETSASPSGTDTVHGETEETTTV